MTSERETYDNPLITRYAWPDDGRALVPAAEVLAPGGGSGSPWPRPSANSGSDTITPRPRSTELRAHVDDIDFDAAPRSTRSGCGTT